VNHLKPWLQFADVRASEVGPSNPFGFFSDHRRLDTEQGVDLLLSNWCAPAAALGVEGIIFWTPCGHSTRGAMYRPDTHMLPVSIARNWPRLMKGLEQLGMRAGVCVRPQHVISDAGKMDVAVQVAESDEILAVAANVTRAWVDRGVRHFYADSFGEFNWHEKILGVMFGCGALKVWMEASCPATLAAGGSIYCEHPQRGPWNSPAVVAAARKLYPNLDVLCIPREPIKDYGGAAATYLDVVKMGYRPLFQDYELRASDKGKNLAAEACRLIRAMSRPKRDEGETKRPKVVK
jgi:hypothetical protein